MTEMNRYRVSAVSSSTGKTGMSICQISFAAVQKERWKRAGDCLEFSSGVRILYSQQVIGQQIIYTLLFNDKKSLAAVDCMAWPIITPTLISNRVVSYALTQDLLMHPGEWQSLCYQTKRFLKKTFYFAKQ